MFQFRTLRCCNCQSVMVNLPEEELKKLSGLSFRCECCNHLNHLNESVFEKTKDQNTTSIYNLIQPVITT